MIVKAYVEVISCCFMLVEVIVVVHLILVVVVTVLVTVVRGARFSQAHEMIPGLQVERAVGVGSEGLFSTEARRLLTERVGPLNVSNTDLTVSMSQTDGLQRSKL